jgi:CDP-diglyceride synthetase
MNIFSDFISKENKRYKFQLGKTLASALTGFICGAIVASIIWYFAPILLGAQ